ncbi:MAG: hypothetical protein ACI841_004035 [Planctomycetota bacterium]|jgi:hypothetical protein
MFELSEIQIGNTLAVGLEKTAVEAGARFGIARLGSNRQGVPQLP